MGGKRRRGKKTRQYRRQGRNDWATDREGNGKPIIHMSLEDIIAAFFLISSSTYVYREKQYLKFICLLPYLLICFLVCSVHLFSPAVKRCSFLLEQTTPVCSVILGGTRASRTGRHEWRLRKSNLLRRKVKKSFPSISCFLRLGPSLSLYFGSVREYFCLLFFSGPSSCFTGSCLDPRPSPRFFLVAGPEVEKLLQANRVEGTRFLRLAPAFAHTNVPA